jgi:small redox-active disulfide protein 2
MSIVDIKIFGSGCAKCVKLAENAQAAVRELGLDYSVEKVTDLAAIVDAGVLTTPALVINGEVKSSGQVLDVEQLKTIIG